MFTRWTHLHWSVTIGRWNRASMRPMLTSLAVCCSMQTDTQLPLIVATGLYLHNYSTYLPLSGPSLSLVGDFWVYVGSVLGLSSNQSV